MTIFIYSVAKLMKQSLIAKLLFDRSNDSDFFTIRYISPLHLKDNTFITLPGSVNPWWSKRVKFYGLFIYSFLKLAF